MKENEVPSVGTKLKVVNPLAGHGKMGDIVTVIGYGTDAGGKMTVVMDSCGCRHSHSPGPDMFGWSWHTFCNIFEPFEEPISLEEAERAAELPTVKQMLEFFGARK